MNCDKSMLHILLPKSKKPGNPRNSTEKFLAFHAWLSWLFLAFPMCKKVRKARNDSWLSRIPGFLGKPGMFLAFPGKRAFYTRLSWLSRCAKKHGKPGMIPDQAFQDWRVSLKARNVSWLSWKAWNFSPGFPDFP